MRSFGQEKTILSNDSALLALLAGCFPNINVKTWEVTPLAGLSGGTYHLRSHTLNLIARAQSQAQTALFVNRRKEARVLHQLQHFGQAPKVLARNSDWLLLSWCDGQQPSDTQFLTPTFQSLLAATIAKLHTQPLLTYRLQLRQEIAHYGYLVDPKRQGPRWHRWHHHFLSAPMPRVLKLAPAHMDIHKGNIVCTESGQLVLLDWEYAANTDIGLSLETYFQANQLNTTQRDFFLSEYCNKYHAYGDVERLAHQCRLWTPWVKYMMLMWYEVQWNQSQNNDFLLHSRSLRQYFSLPS